MPSKTIDSQIKWQGRSWRLRTYQFKQGNDSIIERGVVEHPGSVVIFPMLGEQVLILRQYRLALDRWILELPAGTIDDGEDWLACAKRELREETGYQAQKWQDLGKIWPAPGLTDESMGVFLATDLTEAPLEPDADERIELARYPVDELVDMALDGRMQDAKSVVATLRSNDYLSKLR